MLISDTFINRSWDLQDMHFSASIYCTHSISQSLSLSLLGPLTFSFVILLLAVSRHVTDSCTHNVLL